MAQGRWWRGQITIPQAIRERWGLLPHTEVHFVEEGGTDSTSKQSRCHLTLRAGTTILARWWACSTREPKLLPVPAQPAQISSRSIASPGNWGSPSRRVAASSRRGGAGDSASGPQTSTARSAGINSQPRRAPLR